VLGLPSTGTHVLEVWTTSRHQVRVEASTTAVLALVPGKTSGMTTALPPWQDVVLALVQEGTTAAVSATMAQVVSVLTAGRTLGLPPVMNTPHPHCPWGLLLLPVGTSDAAKSRGRPK
jgi:hypothetical protein